MKIIERAAVRSGEELQINAVTGAHFLKSEYEKTKAVPAGAVMARTTDWASS